VLQILNIDYDTVDLSQVSAADLKNYKQVWAFTTDEVDARDQQVIVDYARAGGHVVIYPCLPDRELSQKPCTIIRDALNISPDGKEVIDSPLIDVLGFSDIKCANPQMTYHEEALIGAEVIAHTLSGKICGFSKALGEGKVVHLGTWLGFDTESHKQVYEVLVKAAGAGIRQAAASSENLAVRQRFTPAGSATLFIGNYYNEEQNGKVFIPIP
jgi:beta-galactosidase